MLRLLNSKFEIKIMDNKQVNFAKHNIFYKKFFEKHAELLKGFILLKFETLDVGYSRLLTFYSSYSYYLRDGSMINKVIINERDELINSNEYKNIKNKSKNNIKLNVNELLKKNDLFYNNLLKIFEKFEDFCSTLAPDSIMPDLTDNVSDYQKNVLFASYETFYENFFNFHAQIGDMLNNFNILNFLDTFKSLMAFYYGHSFYVSKYTKNQIEEEFKEIWNIYNNKEYMFLFYVFIFGNINNNQIEKLKNTQDNLFNRLNYVFDLINNDLPKKNMMPKKKEKINVDRTGI